MLVATISGIVTLLGALIAGWVTLSRAAHDAATAREKADAEREERREQAEAAREERRRQSSEVRETALLDVFSRSAATNAQIGVALDAIRQTAASQQRSNERIVSGIRSILDALDPHRSTSDRPSVEDPPPPIPDGASVAAAGRRPTLPSLPAIAAPLEPGRLATLPES